MIKLLKGELSSEKTLDRVLDLLRIGPGLLIPLLRGSDEHGCVSIHNVTSHGNASSSGKAEEVPGMDVLGVIAECAEANERVVVLSLAAAPTNLCKAVLGTEKPLVTAPGGTTRRHREAGGSRELHVRRHALPTLTGAGQARLLHEPLPRPAWSRGRWFRSVYAVYAISLPDTRGPIAH